MSIKCDALLSVTLRDSRCWDVGATTDALVFTSLIPANLLVCATCQKLVQSDHLKYKNEKKKKTELRMREGIQPPPPPSSPYLSLAPPPPTLLHFYPLPSPCSCSPFWLRSKTSRNRTLPKRHTIPFKACSHAARSGAAGDLGGKDAGD